MKKKPEEDSAAYGMELRDYFATAALQGLLAASPDGRHSNIWDLARDSYKLADAMLEIRAEKS